MNRRFIPTMFSFGNRRRRRQRQPAAPTWIARVARIFSAERGESGETMLEFAIVAPLLILLMLMIIDLGIMLMAQSLLDGAARDAARLVRTGQVASAGAANGVTLFQNQLCADMSPIISTSTCQTSVIFNVQKFTDFGTVAFNSCNSNPNGGGGGTPCQFTPGNGTETIGVQVTYNRKFIIPWVDACLTTGNCWFGAASRGGAGGASNSVPLVSTVLFKNEPFPTPSS